MEFHQMISVGLKDVHDTKPSIIAELKQLYLKSISSRSWSIVKFTILAHYPPGAQRARQRERAPPAPDAGALT